MSETNERSQYLSFFIAGEEYAIPILRVREIIAYSKVTPVPSTPSYIRGVINIRGSVVPVIDLAVKFGLAPTAVTKTSCIVVVELSASEQNLVGVITESVRQVIDLAPAEIEKPPAFGIHGRVDFLLGMGVVASGFVLLLDIDIVLSTTEILSIVADRGERDGAAAENEERRAAALETTT